MLSKDRIYLRPWNILDVEGKMAFCEGAQAWVILRLKKELLAEFPQLKEKRSQFIYNITFVKDYESLLDFINKFKKENKPIPLLVWFCKVKEEIK